MKRLKTGIITKGTSTENKQSVDVSGWKIEIHLDQRKDGGAFIYPYKLMPDGSFEPWYDYWVESEELIPKFLSETNWEIEWQE